MRDKRLRELNFRELLDFGAQPRPVSGRYPMPLHCEGYCVSCEDGGLLQNTEGRLDLMSHGCDSDDFDTVLGPMPGDGAGVEQHILFLLENPGADYGNGAPVPFRGHRKQPPINHYYWAPSITCWPHELEQFKGNFYGPYFAYLMWRHQLRNVYITNLVKCKWTTCDGKSGRTPARIVAHCSEHYLKREVELFAPGLVLCFGWAAEKGFRDFSRRAGLTCPAVSLAHPAYIQNRSYTHELTPKEVIRQNDCSVRKALARLA